MKVRVGRVRISGIPVKVYLDDSIQEPLFQVDDDVHDTSAIFLPTHYEQFHQLLAALLGTTQEIVMTLLRCAHQPAGSSQKNEHDKIFVFHYSEFCEIMSRTAQVLAEIQYDLCSEWKKLRKPRGEDDEAEDTVGPGNAIAGSKCRG